MGTRFDSTCNDYAHLRNRDVFLITTPQQVMVPTLLSPVTVLCLNNRIFFCDFLRFLFNLWWIIKCLILFQVVLSLRRRQLCERAPFSPFSRGL